MVSNNENGQNSQNLEESAGLNASGSGSQSSASSYSTSTSLANSKNLMFQRKSPKILNLYLSIVLGVFLCFILVTSINFIIYIRKKNDIDLSI